MAMSIGSRYRLKERFWCFAMTGILLVLWPGAFHLVSILKNRRRDVPIGSRIMSSAYSTLLTGWGKIALIPLLSQRIHTCYSEGVLQAGYVASENGVGGPRDIRMGLVSKRILGERHHRDFSAAAARLTRNDRFLANVILRHAVPKNLVTG